MPTPNKYFHLDSYNKHVEMSPGTLFVYNKGINFPLASGPASGPPTDPLEINDFLFFTGEYYFDPEDQSHDRVWVQAFNVTKGKSGWIWADEDWLTDPETFVPAGSL